MIPLLLAPPAQPEVLVEEKVDFEAKSLNWFVGRPNHFYDFSKYENFGNHGRSTLIRHLSDDTFDVKNVVDFKPDSAVETPYLNVNNKIEFSGSSAVVSQRQDVNDRNFEWSFHHSILENTKFDDLSTITFGDDIHVDVYSYTKPVARHIVFLKKQELQKNINASFDQVVHLRSIKGFSAQFEDGYNGYSWQENDVSRGTVPTKLTFSYSDIYIVPIQPDQANGNGVLAKIYIGNSDNSDPTHDFAIGSGKLKTSSLPTGDLSTSFEYKPNKEEKYKDTNAYYIGDINVSDSTFYDYSANKTVSGFGTGAKYADTIPYGFKGDFKRDLNISLNSVFKDIHLRFSKNIDKPFLSPSEGIVRLSVSTNNEPKQMPRRHFSPEDIKIIREKEQTLVGLERLLNED